MCDLMLQSGQPETSVMPVMFTAPRFNWTLAEYPYYP